MSLSQRLVSILSAPFCCSLSLEAPLAACGAPQGRAGPSTEIEENPPGWEEPGGRGIKESTSSLGHSLPTALTKQPEPSAALHPFCPVKVLEGVSRWQGRVTRGKLRPRLGACSEGAGNDREKLLLGAWRRENQRPLDPSPSCTCHALPVLRHGVAGKPCPSFEGNRGSV